MNNIPEYLRWRGDIPMTQVPYNEIDAYILAKTVEPDFTDVVKFFGPGVTLSEAFDLYFAQTDRDPDYFGQLYLPILSKTLRQVAESPRFKDLVLSDYRREYDEHQSEQFSAITVALPYGEHVVVFRGTDDTIAGWKEDFLMAVENPVPAQADALAYLGSAATKFQGPLSVIGHSKGGNLAIFAAANVTKTVQDRITKVYNFDGPGFFESFWEEPGTKRILDRLRTYVSQESIVGTLFQNRGPIELCKSMRTGATAHEALYWEVIGASFVRAECYTPLTFEISRLVNNRMMSMSNDEIRGILDDFFGGLASTGAATLTDIGKQPAGQRLQILKAITESENIKKFGKDIVALLLSDKTLLSRLLRRGIPADEKDTI